VSLEPRSVGNLRRGSSVGINREDLSRAPSGESEPALCSSDANVRTRDAFPYLPMLTPCLAGSLGTLAFYGPR
jgi:hypothetical protein